MIAPQTPIRAVTLVVIALVASIAGLSAWLASSRQVGDRTIAFLPLAVQGPTYPPMATRTAERLTSPPGTVGATSTAGAQVVTPAATSRYRDSWTHLPMSHGVERVAVDPTRGRVWSGGYGGVLAWDPLTGESRRYTMTDGLPSHHASIVEVATDGTVWMGSYNDGAARMLADGRWETFTFTPDGIAHGVQAIGFDISGGVWFATGDGVSRLGPDGAWEHHLEGANGPKNLVSSMAFDQAGNAWFGTHSGGLNVLRPDRTWRTWGKADGLPFDSVSDVAVDAAQRVWVVSEGYVSGSIHQPAVNILSPDGQLTRFDVSGWIADGVIHAVAFDDQDRPWFAADTGVFAPTPGGAWTRVGVAEGLAADRATHLQFDATGNLWVATENGLSRRDRAGTWATFRRDGFALFGASGISIAPTGYAWLASGNEGLMGFQPEAGREPRADEVRQLTIRDGLFTDDVAALAEDGAGGLWLSTVAYPDETRGGVHHRFANGRMESFSLADGLGSPYVTDIAVDKAGNTWFVGDDYRDANNQEHAGGLTRRSAEGAWTRFGAADGLPGAGVPNALTVAADGTVWVGTEFNPGRIWETLARLTSDGRWVAERAPVPSTVHALASDPVGNLWVSTAEGLFVRSPDGRWTTAIEDPSLDFDTHEITVAPDGAVWFSDDSGTRVRHPDGRWEALTLADGLPQSPVDAIAFAPDGSIWFAGAEDGVSILRP